MNTNETLAHQILCFVDKLSVTKIDLPTGYRLINPFNSEQSASIRKVTTSFYQKYYADTHSRRMILGSSPARRGSAVTGVPFEDASHLYNETGISIDGFHVNKASSDFLYDVMSNYGGCQRFYADFYMSFVCPLGVVRKNAKGHEVNCNYYENKSIVTALYSFMIDALQIQVDFGLDTSVCFCIGSGENYKWLSRINDSFHFFGQIIPLEHPRYIMQYNSANRDFYMDKYLTALRNDPS